VIEICLVLFSNRYTGDWPAAVTAKLLLAYNASLNATDNEGRTPFQLTPGRDIGCAGDADNRSGYKLCPKLCKVRLVLFAVAV
jgi:hypothetical protein